MRATDARQAFLLDPIAHYSTGWSHREGGSVWCWMIHVYAIIEAMLQWRYQAAMRRSTTAPQALAAHIRKVE